jgi:hypothetical protein
MPGIDNYSLDNYGLDGPGGAKYASGEVSSSTMRENFINNGGAEELSYFVVVGGFGFVPDVILLKSKSANNFYNQTYIDTKLPKQSGFTIFPSGIKLFYLTGIAYINENGFKIPVGLSGSTFEWQAFKTE